MDRISELPDEIISHILSSLPLKEAVATSILSQRWSSLWKYSPNLVFVNNPYRDPMINIPIAVPIGESIDLALERSLKNVEWVNLILDSYKALSLKQFTISFYMDPKAFDQVSKWLHFAFSRRVESLKLNLGWSPSVLDVNMLSSIQSSDYRFLRELTLQNLVVSGEAIEFLLRSCSVLGRLIMNATLTSDVVIGGTLKYLEIDTLRSFINFSAPNLTRLVKFHRKKLLVENVPNLVEASFHLYVDETMLQFSKAAAKLEALTITLYQPLAFAVPRMPRLKKLVVDYALVNHEYILPITCLLEASPCLEEFKLDIRDLRKYYVNGVFSTMAIFNVPERGGFAHDHLKVFEFSGFFDRDADHVELVRYIGKKCVGLQEIVITPISASIACRFEPIRNSTTMDIFSFLRKRMKRDILDMKKCTEEVLAGKLPDRIKLIIN